MFRLTSKNIVRKRFLIEKNNDTGENYSSDLSKININEIQSSQHDKENTPPNNTDRYHKRLRSENENDCQLESHFCDGATNAATSEESRTLRTYDSLYETFLIWKDLIITFISNLLG
ncbi:unnamed protein product [Heterobilharzia americana]|nr:unnamed protein product [Heterobilharzia americana]